MSLLSGRYSSLFTVTLTVLLATVIGGGYYYYQIKQNENYQNQLHFRELKDIRQTVDSGLQQLQSIAAEKEKESSLMAELSRISDARQTIEQARMVDIGRALVATKKKLKVQWVTDSFLIKAMNEQYLKLLECLRQNRLTPTIKCQSALEGLDSSLGNAQAKRVALERLSKRGTILKNIKIWYDEAPKVTKQQQEYLQLGTATAPLTGQGTHVISKVGAIGATLYAPLVDFLGAKSSRYPLVLMVDDQGNRLVRKENVENDSAQHGLIFAHLDQLLATLFAQQQAPQNNNATDLPLKIENVNLNTDQAINKTTDRTANDKVPGYSGYIDVAITGVEYRVFITPYHSALIKNDQGQSMNYYLLGFKPKSTFSSKRLAISNSLIVIVVFVLLALIALIPSLKLRLVSTHNAYSARDRWWLMAGIVLFFAILTIGAFNLLFYTQLKNELNQQAKHSFNQIKSSFATELNSLNAYAAKESKGLLVDVSEDMPFDQPEVSNQYSYLLENLIVLPADGKLRGQAKWSGKNLYRSNNINLSNRAYFKRSLACNAWDQNRCDKLFLQRIYNLRDGRSTTQFSRPLFDSLDVPLKNRQVQSFGTHLQSFFAAVLPQNFGFLVFENQSGEVLYHSDDARSLIENIYVETDNNPTLHGLKWLTGNTSQQGSLYGQNGKSGKSFTMKTVYRGEDHLFEVGKLQSDIPWSLVVFYSKNQMRLLNMFVAFTSLGLFCLLLGLACLLTRLFVFNPSILRRLFWYDALIGSQYWLFGRRILLLMVAVNSLIFYLLVVTRHSANYQWWLIGLVLLVCWVAILISLYYAIGLTRTLAKSELELHQRGTDRYRLNPPGTTHPRAFSLYLFSLLLGFAIMPAFLLSVISSEFYLQRYADLEAVHIQTQLKRSANERTEYFKLIADGDKARHFTQWADHVPCYLRHLPVDSIIDGRGRQPAICSFVDTEKMPVWMGTIKHQHNQPHSGLMANILHQIAVKSPFANKIVALNQGQKQQHQPLHLGYLNPMIEPEQVLAVDVDFAKLMLTGVRQQWGLVLLVLLIVGLFSHFILYQLVVIRLMGLLIPDNFRLNDRQPPERLVAKVELLINRLRSGSLGGRHQAFFVQVIRPTVELMEMLRANANDLALVALQPMHIDELIKSDKTVAEVCEEQLKVSCQSPVKTVILKGMELVAMQKSQREKALAVMEYLVSLGHINVVLLTENVPLHRLTRQAAYPNKLPQAEHATVSEVTRWVKVMNFFNKFYDWTPSTKYALEAPDNAHLVLTHEAQGWPELADVQIQFFDYHRTVNGVKEDETLAASVNAHWSAVQIIEFFNANTGAFYRYRWELCTRNERLLLIQMAYGGTPNSQDPQPLEHLMRRGYIFRDNGWHIVNQSFKSFIQSAEEPKVVKQWVHSASKSTWKTLRIPIFILVFAVMGVMLYTATEAAESFLAILTAVLGLLPLLADNMNLEQGETDSSDD